MTYSEFLEKVIDGGIAAAKRDYAEPRQAAKLEGSVAGFIACRALQPGDLAILREQAAQKRKDAHDRQVPQDQYWSARCFELEVAYVCNVVAAALLTTEIRPRLELPSPFLEWTKLPEPVTARGVMHAAKIVGVEP